MLSINKEAVFNSSALLPNPLESFTPNNIGETTRCATIILRILSSERNWYWLCASLNWIGSILAAVLTSSLKDKINLPLLELPLNF